MGEPGAVVPPELLSRAAGSPPDTSLQAGQSDFQEDPGVGWAGGQWWGLEWHWMTNTVQRELEKQRLFSKMPEELQVPR